MKHLNINKFGLRNFRIFKEMTELEFAPITIFTGANNSGKSTVIKALMLLKQNLIFEIDDWRHYYIFEKLDFTMKGHNLGNFNKCLNKYALNDSEISFRLPFPFHFINENMAIEFTYKLDNTNDLKNGFLTSLVVFNKNNDEVVKVRKNKKDMWISWFKFSYFRDKLNCIVDNDFKKLKKIHSAKNVITHPSDYELSYLGKNYDSLNPIHYSPLLLELDVNNKFFEKLHEDYYSSYYDKLKEAGIEDCCLKSKTKFNELLIGGLREQNNIIKEELRNNGIYFSNDIELINMIIDDELKLYENYNIERVIDIDKNDPVQKRLNDIMNRIDDYLSFVKSNKTSNKAIPEEVLKKSIVMKTLLLKEKLEKENPLYRVLNEIYSDQIAKGVTIIQRFVDDFVKKGFYNAIESSINSFKNFDFIESVRANTQRVYTFQSQGTVFNALIKDFISLGIDDSSKEIQFINYWIKKFNLGKKLNIKVNEEGIGTIVYIDATPLADLGYGVTQFLPLLIKIAFVAKKNYQLTGEILTDFGDDYLSSTLIIEEPETNLHPKLQSLLADMFVDAANKFNIQFGIETHSEYLIRKLQYLIANKEHEYNIKPEDTAIYYFNDPKLIKKGDKQVHRIKIKENGILDGSFGPGFFDEASNLIKEVFKISGAN